MTSSESWTERILRVLDHIQNHLDQELAPEELAALAGFSLHHFHRVFRGMTEESVMGFVRRLRLERAAQRLKYGQASVTEVAFSSGYNSHEAFTRAFRAHFGRSPSAYRDELSQALKDVPLLLRQEPERRVIALRHVGPYEECFDAWTRLMQWGATNRVGQELPGIGLCYDDPDVTEPNKIRYDACLALTDEEACPPAPLPAGFSERIVPAGRYAIAIHQGPYDDINETYVSLIGKWLPGRGIELHDEPVVEVYVRGFDKAAPQDLLTEVTVRITETE